jgi:hypothetical protein
MDNPTPSSTHPREGSLHSENLMSLSEEERNPRHFRKGNKQTSTSEQSKHSYAIIRIYRKFLYTRVNILVCAVNVPTAELGNRRKIRYIESNAKCHHQKNLPVKGLLRQVFYLSEAPSPPTTPYSSPPLSHCIRVYSILIHTAKGGELTREKVTGAMLYNAGRK